ncbi:MAG TPA: type IX secretion system membrane protein PorP/SprF [Bacteroidales bacterium]|nr:type IX secretion system membrane protein PorP/SprF [Bacteroidales bacterium]
MRRLLSTLTLVLLASITSLTFAQNDPHFSLFEFSQLTYNPGYAGSNNGICVSSVHRQQYVGFNRDPLNGGKSGRPITTVFNAEMPLKAINSGVGLSIIQDMIGFQSDLALNVSYAYRVDLGYGSLGIGLNLGFINRTIDGDWITPESLGGGTVYTDPAVPHSESKVAFDMGFGAFFKYDKFYAGLSFTHLLQPSINFDIESPSYIKRHYYLVGGYNYQLPNPTFEVRPSLLMQFDGATTQFTFNGQFVYSKKIWGGISYRYNDAISPMLGIYLMNGLSFAYSYDIELSPLSTYSSGSHEIMVRYCFNADFGGDPGRYRSVRRL